MEAQWLLRPLMSHLECIELNKKPLTIQTALLTTTMTSPTPTRNDSDTSYSRSSTLDEDPKLGSDLPSITQIYTDAARYEKVLVCNKNSSIHSSSSDDCVAGFTQRFGKDLSVVAPEQGELHEAIAKLSVAGDTFTPSDSSSDSDTYADSPESNSPESDDAGFDPEDLEKRLAEATSKEQRRSSTTDGESWRIPATEVVDLLIQEFGSLTLEGDQEKLILEADTALFQDVVILVHI
jgi:sterol 3beta-glucosyltransferase